MTSPEHVKQVKTTLNPAKQRSARAKNNSSTTAKSPADVAACKRTIHIGIFFDGTDNNMERDTAGGKKCYTNIVSLFNAYEENTDKGYYKFYVPGVGTKFPAIGEYTEDETGKSVGWGGGRRIYYAIFQILNTINKVVNGQILFPKSVVKFGVSNPGIKNGGKMEAPNDTILTPKQIMASYIAKLNKKITGSEKPVIEGINISVFGFSRGAAQARAFVNVLHEVVGASGKICNIKTTFNFLGLFDTVASVQFPYSSPIAGGKFGAEGLLSWADGTMKIHPRVKHCIHFVAGHEFRASFPLSSIMLEDSYETNHKEVVYPGVHCDLGGGYAPGDQGKSIDSAAITQHEEEEKKLVKYYDDLEKTRYKAFKDYKYPSHNPYSDNNSIARGWGESERLRKIWVNTKAEKIKALKKHTDKLHVLLFNKRRQLLLSQVPLRHMFEEAYEHVIPLMSYDEMKNKYPDIHKEFMVDPIVESLLSNYISIFKKDIKNHSEQSKPNINTLQNLFYRSQELYLRWRWSIQKPMGIQSLQSLQSLPFYLYAARGADEYRWRKKYKGAVMKLKSYAFANAQEKWDKVEANKDYLIDMWEIFEQKNPTNNLPIKCRGSGQYVDNIAYIQFAALIGGELDSQLHQLFDEFVHDSHAGFYIAGPRSDYEKEEFYQKAIKKSAPSNFDKELIKNGLENFPLMTDESVSDLRMGGLGSAVQWSMGASSCRPTTRREAGGHVKARWLMDSNAG